MASRKFKFHILGLVHLPTSEEYMACAFTQKNVKLCKMLLDMGHQVILYGSEGSTAPCTQFVQTHTLKEIRDTWGEGDNRYAIGYDYPNKQFKHDINGDRTALTQRWYKEVTQKILETKEPDDFLIVTQGSYQKPVADAVELYLTCESGIGYRGSFAKYGRTNQLDNHRAFESTYIQNFTYGSEHPRESINGNFYDRVIPNYFDPKDFPYELVKDDYFLYMGRMIHRKGVFIAIETCRILGKKLVLAGQLSDEIGLEQLKGFNFVEFVGFADAKKRAQLVSHAKAVFAPTYYLEPFCGVHVESMLCGTPVITTNFGVFPDTVIDGVNGFKCDTLNDFVLAAKNIDSIDPAMVKQTAQRYTLESVSKMYQKWFDDLYDVYESTIDPTAKGWSRIKI